MRKTDKNRSLSQDFLKKNAFSGQIAPSALSRMRESLV